MSRNPRLGSFNDAHQRPPETKRSITFVRKLYTKDQEASHESRSMYGMAVI